MILQIKRGNRVIAESADFSYSPSLQEVRKLTCEVVSVVPIEFKAYNSKSESEYDTVVYNGNTFILYQAPSGDNLNEAGKYKYSLLFYGKEVLLQNVAFLDIVSGTGGEINKIRYTHGGLFQFWGDAKQLAARIEANIQSYNASLGAGYTGIGTWTLNVDAEGELTEDMIDITDGTNLFEALKNFYDKFYLNYYFSTTANGGIITITDKARPSVNWTFKQGDGGGAVKVSSSVDTSTPVITRIIPQGGSRNVPPEYKKDAKPADESRYCPYILLPNDSDGNIRYYIDSEYGLKNYGVRGKTISNTFSGIYPSIRGKKLGDLYPSGLPEWDTYKADGEPDPQSGKVAGEGASASTRIDKIIGSTPIKSDDSDSFFIYMTSPGFNLGYKVYEDGDSSDKINDNVQPQYKPHAMFDKYRDFESFDIYGTRAYYDQPVKVTATFSGKMLFSVLPIGSDAVGKKVKINLRMVTNRVLGQASPLKEVVIGEEGATGMLEIPYDKTALVGYIEKGQNTTVTIRIEFTFDSDVPAGSCKIGFSEEMTCNIHFGNQDGSQDRFYYKYASVTDAVFSMRTGTYTGTEFKINKNGIIPLYGEVNGDTGETEEDVAMFNKGARYKISCYRTDSDNAKLPLYTDGKSPSIAAGTEFVILNIVMPESYVTMAENTLEKAALDYLSRYDHENRTVSLDISSGFVAEHPNLFIDFIEGNMLKVRDDGIGVFDFSDNGQIVDMQLQIQSLEIKYSKDNLFPSYSCTIARRKILSFYERLAQENQTVSTQNTTNVTLGGSGTGSGTNIFSEQLLNDLIASFQKFNGWFEWDEEKQALRCKSAFYTNQWISALGAQSGGGSPGGGGIIQSVYGFADLGKTFNNDTLTDTFNAYTINEIWKLAKEGGMNADKLWQELGKDDATKKIHISHLPDNKYVTIDTEQTVTANKIFTGQLSTANIVPSVNNASTLGLDTKRWENIYSVSANISGTITSNNVKTNSLQVGDIKIVYDSTNKAVTFEHIDGSTTIGLYTKGWISALGVSPGGGGGGSGLINNVYGYSSLGTTFSDTDLNNTFNAYTINEIWKMAKEGGGIKNITPSGSGNAVTDMSLSSDGKTITVVFGEVFAKQQDLGTLNNTVTQLSNKLNDFLEGSDTDNIINKWKELEAFLEGLTESDNLADLLALKADKTITISAGAGLTGGGNLSANRTISLATSGVKAGTYTKVTVDAYGRVTVGDNPTTLAGYGITDAVTLTTAQTISGRKTFSQNIVFNNNGGITYTDANVVLRNSDGHTILASFGDGSINLRPNGHDNTEGAVWINKTGNVQAPTVSTNTITIGDAQLVYDSANKALRVKHKADGNTVGLYSDGWITALGVATGGSGGGSGAIKTVYSFANLTDGTTFSDTDLNNTFNAYTINEIWKMAKEGGGIKNITPSGSGNAVTDMSLSSDGKTITVVFGEVFAKQQDLGTLNNTVTQLSNKLNDFLEGSDTDNIINKWKELEAFLEGLTESDNLADLLALKADKTITISAGAGLTGGGNLSANRTISLATSGVKAGTYTKVTVDAYGRVTVGDNPTTLAGYGITDAVTLTTAQTISGRKTFSQNIVFNNNGGITYTDANVVLRNSDGHTILASFGDGSINLRPNGHDNTEGAVWINKTGNVQAPTVSTNTITIGDAQLVYDSANKALRVKHKADGNTVGLYSDGWITALGVATGGSGGGSGAIKTVYSFANLTDGTTFSDTDLNNTFNAYTIKKIYDMAGQGGLDATAMWNELKKADSSKVIDASHIPTSVLDGRWVKKAGDTMTGTLTSASTTGSIIFKGLENCDITNIYKDNGVIKNDDGGLTSIRNGLRFNWYDTYWYIGNLRGSSTESAGFGVVDHNNKLVLRVTPNDVRAPKFMATVATGTAPFIVSSTTLVSNLNADLLDGQHGAYYQNRAYDTFVSQYNQYDYIEFLRFVIPSGQNQLRAYVVFDLCRTETGNESSGRAVLRLRRNPDNTASTLFYVTNFGRSTLPELRCTSDDGIIWRIWMKCNKSGYDPYIAVKIVEQYPYGYVTTQNNGTTGTPEGTRHVFTALSAGISNAANFLVNSRTLWGQPFNGTANVSGDMTGVGSITMSGDLKIGNATSPNTIYFYGTTGDGPGGYSHTFIAERIWGGTECSELVLFKGNDLGNGTDAITVSNTGPDRIRHIAAAHLFQTYTTVLSGSVESVCTSSALKNLFSIASSRVISYVQLQSTIASGVAPFIVASNTVVSNLNADLLDGQHLSDLDGRYVNVTGDTMTGDLTMNNTKGFNMGSGTRVVKTSGNWIHGGADVASSTDANLRFASWYGIGWYPTIDTASGVRQGNNAMWLNVRNGNLDTHGAITAHTNYLAANWDSARRLVLGGGSSYAWIDSRNSSNNVLCNIVLQDNKVTIGNYAESSRFVSTVGTGTAPYQCSSTTLNTNLNSDLLDGYHQGSFMRTNGVNQYVTLTGGNGNTAGYRLVLDVTISGGWSINGMTLLVNSRHSGTGILSIVFHTTNEANTTYTGGINYYGNTTSLYTSTWRLFYNTSTKKLRLFWYYADYNDCYVTILNGRRYLTDISNATWYTSLPSDIGTELPTNYNAVDKLITGRTINGTTFDGTANITTSYWGTTRTFYTNSHDSYRASAGVNVNGSGNVTLLLPNSIRCSDWFRSTGNTGWYHENYGGGWYMTDSNYIRNYNSKRLRIQTDTYDTIQLVRTSGSGGSSIAFYNGGGTFRGQFGMNATSWFTFDTGTATANQNVVEISPAGGIHSKAEITAKASGSDIRLKKDIQNYNAMDIINKFRSVKYHWNDVAKANSEVYNNDYDQFGLIAQDLIAGGFKQWVRDVFHDYYTVTYERLIPVVWKGLQEVDDEVTRLKKRVRELENRLGIYNQ